MMHIRDLMPWHRDRTSPAAANGDTEHPFLALQRDMNRVFDSFFDRFDKPFAMFGGEPRLDMAETDGAVRVTVELPGIDQKDVEISATDNLLTIRGEKREETESGEGARHIVERRYGSFQRAIPLPPGLDMDKAEARFDKGVLTVTLPKTPEAKAAVRKIAVTPA
jgi:HSP20 family protein